MYVPVSRDSSAMCGRISSAPSEQFTPATRGSACSIERQNASTVCPDSVRPLRSTIVTEIHKGSCGATSRAAAIAAFAFSVSKIVSTSSRSAPPSASACTCSAYAAYTWSNDIARYAGSSTRGDSDNVTFSGPIDPATKRPPASSAACRASWAPRTFISRTSACSP